MTRPEATAIVVTHNSVGQISATLHALRQAGLPVRVVDNASTDGTVELIGREFPEVTLTASRHNLGFAAAVNQAVQPMTSEVVLLVNPDCVVPPETTRELLRILRTCPSVGIAGPRLLDAAGQVAISAHPFESWSTVVASRFGGSLVPVAVRRLLCGNRRRGTYDACRDAAEPVAVDWLSGAALAVRTELFRQIGGLDERYFLYYEDEEFCLQAHRRGARVLYVPAVRAVHTGGASSSDPAWIWPHLYRSMLLFFARHRRRSLRVVRGAVLLRALIGLGLAGIRMPLQPRHGAARMRAWSRIGRIALTPTANLTDKEPACTS